VLKYFFTCFIYTVCSIYGLFEVTCLSLYRVLTLHKCEYVEIAMHICRTITEFKMLEKVSNETNLLLRKS